MGDLKSPQMKQTATGVGQRTKNVGFKHPINQNDRKGSFRIQKSCKYCGKIHDECYKCSKKPIKRKKIDDTTRFRNSPKWQKKRKYIKKRDNYLCQICLRNLYGTKRKYNSDNLQVHHAIPINSNKDLKLDESNLITLCSMHYSLCDKGKIPYGEVKNIIIEQNQK